MLGLQADAGNRAVADLVSQMRCQLSAGIGGKVVQRAILDNHRLNVVGEDHEISSPQRELERRFAATESGSNNYWTESEFEVRSKKWWERLLDRPLPKADPFNLRFDYIIKNVESNLTILHDRVGGGGATNDHEFESIWRKILTLRVMWNNAQRGVEVGDIAPALVGNEMADLLDRLRDNFAAARRRPTQDALHEAKAVATLTKNVVPDARAKDQVSEARSRFMHEAAVTRSQELGVWKIGNAHLIDIDEAGLPYNTVLASQFERAVRDYEKEHGGQAVANAN